MIEAIATTRALPWPVALPQRRLRLPARGTVARQAVRHGVRGAVQAVCLSAAVMAAAGAAGASRGPVVLSEPGHTQAVLLQGSSPTASVGDAGKVTAR